MKPLTPGHWILHLLILLNRLSLGLYFLCAGVDKIRAGMRSFVDGTFTTLRPLWLPDAIARPYGYALPILEVVFGGMLILGLVGRLTAAVVGLMILSYTIAIIDAGMFVPQSGGPFHYNVIFITLAALLAVTGSGRLSLDAVWCRRCRA